MPHKKYLLSFAAAASLLFNAVPFAVQTPAIVLPRLHITQESGPPDGTLKIENTETATSMGATAEDTKVIESPEGTVANTQNGETKTSYNEKDMSMTTVINLTQKAEAGISDHSATFRANNLNFTY